MLADYRNKLCLGGRQSLLLPERGGGRLEGKPRGRAPNWNSVLHSSCWPWRGREGISMVERPSLVRTPQFTRSELELGFWGHSSGQECVLLGL